MHKSLFSLFFFSFLMTLASCGIPLPLKSDKTNGKTETRIHSSSAQSFLSYQSKFESLGKTQLSDPNFTIGDIPINFGDTENPYYKGVCFEYSDGTKEIIIDQNWWEAVDEYNRESLLFHELGHCRLGRDHHDSKVKHSNGQEYKESMMSSVIVSGSNLKNLYNEYVKELFTENKQSLYTRILSL